MTTSNEALTSFAMPFILDGSTTNPPPRSENQVEAYGGGETTHSLKPISPTSPPKPQRTQSATAIPHLPVRVPNIISEIESSDTLPNNTTVAIVPSPRRPRASTGVSRPTIVRTSVEQRPPPTEDDVSWWTEEIHKRREIRRRWKEAEDENMVIIGNKVDTNHPNYVTAYNMLTGLRVAVCFGQADKGTDG